MYNLHVVAHTPVGRFSGHVNETPTADRELLAATRDELEKQANKLNYMVLFSPIDEAVLPGELLKNSVLIFTIKEAT